MNGKTLISAENKHNNSKVIKLKKKKVTNYYLSKKLVRSVHDISLFLALTESKLPNK